MRREFALPKSKPKRWPLVGVFLVVAAYAIWFNALYDETNATAMTAETRAKAANVEYTQLVSLGKDAASIRVLLNNPFDFKNRWGYVSKWHPIPVNYVPSDLVTISVAHAASNQSFQLTQSASKALSTMFAEASDQSHPLIVSSAYRSAMDQEALRSQTIATQGQEYADKYIALPGTSEHQTGLAVDINTYSSECTSNANVCSISNATATWLKNNASRYGFILRYPNDKASLTGISSEPWHFRYIGQDAETIARSGLVYDEIVRKIEPSLFK